MKRLYLAGPIRGHADLNRPAFDAAAAWARTNDWEPVSPLDQPVAHEGPCPVTWPKETGTQGTHARACWLRAGLQALLVCDAIGLLFGWNKSDGARRELQVAEACGIPVLHVPPGGVA
jgi:hypothetical protein